MANPEDSVNEVVRLFERWIREAKSQGNDLAAERHTLRLAGINSLLSEVKELRRWKTPVPASYGDLSDLPDELLAQLSGIKTDELEDQIYAVIKAAGEEIELDRILIELFRRHQTVHERRFLNNKLYRMVSKGLIYAVPGRKGVYTIAPQAAEEPDESGGFKPVKPVRATTAVNLLDLDDEIPF